MIEESITAANNCFKINALKYIQLQISFISSEVSIKESYEKNDIFDWE